MPRSRPMPRGGKTRRVGVVVSLRPFSPRRLRPRTFFRRALAGLVVCFAVLLMTGSPASAHAQLEGSDPVPGDVLSLAPSKVT